MDGIPRSWNGRGFDFGAWTPAKKETAMRSLRTLTVAAGLLGMTPFVAMGQSNPTPEALLNFKPSLKGVEYEAVTDPAAIAACKVETVTNAKKQQIGYALRDGQGKLLRQFLDTDGNRALDQWSYYQDGFEVYRETDLNDDQSLDECRWLNSAGTRIATVDRRRVARSDHGLEADLGRGGLQGPGPGDRELRPRPARRRCWPRPRNSTALGVPEGGDRAGRRRRLETRVAEVKAVLQGLGLEQADHLEPARRDDAPPDPRRRRDRR